MNKSGVLTIVFIFFCMFCFIMGIVIERSTYDLDLRQTQQKRDSQRRLATAQKLYLEEISRIHDSQTY